MLLPGHVPMAGAVMVAMARSTALASGGRPQAQPCDGQADNVVSSLQGYRPCEVQLEPDQELPFWTLRTAISSASAPSLFLSDAYPGSRV